MLICVTFTHIVSVSLCVKNRVFNNETRVNLILVAIVVLVSSLLWPGALELWLEDELTMFLRI